MDLVASIQEDLAGYAGLNEPTVAGLEVILRDIVQTHGKDILLDEDELRTQLESAGVDAREALRVVLLTKVDGFANLVCGDAVVRRVDLDRYAHNAFWQTGLNRQEIARIMRAFVLATGTVDELKQLHGWMVDVRSDDSESERAFTIPTALYDEELRAFGTRLGYALQRGESLDALGTDSLEPLVAMGIPRAQYYLGYCFVHGSDNSETQRRGFELLQAAANAGDSQACAELGDFCYDHGTSEWSAAFTYYTGMGSLALSESRREALTTILNRGRFNKGTLVLGTALLCCMLVTEILGLGAPAYGGHIVLGVLCSILSAGVLALGFLHHRSEPYDDTQVFPIVVFGLWALYMAVRFVF